MYLQEEEHWRHVPLDYQDMQILEAYFTPTQDVSSVRKNGRENMLCMHVYQRKIDKKTVTKKKVEESAVSSISGFFFHSFSFVTCSLSHMTARLFYSVSQTC